MPPPRTTSATSVTAAIGAMCSAMRRASSSTTGRRARRRRAPRRTRRARRRAARAASGRPRRPAARRASTTAAAHGSISSARPEATRSTSPAAPFRPRWSSPRRTSPAPSPVPTERKTKSSTPRRDAAPLLAARGEVDVVVERDRQAEPLDEVGPEVAALEAGDVRRHAQAPGRVVDDGGDADDGAVEQVRPAVRTRPTSDVRSFAIASSADSDLDVAELDVLAGPDRAGQVADRPAQEARAEVEAEHERRVGHRLEEDRAVPRAARLGVGLADEAGLEQRLEREGDGRLGDPRPPRDLRARDRRRAADRLEDGALVQVLEERGDRRPGHVSNNLTERRAFSRLTSADRRVIGSARSET